MWVVLRADMFFLTSVSRVWSQSSHDVNFIGYFCGLSMFVPNCCNCCGLLLGIQIFINNYVCKMVVLKFSTQ